MASGREFVGTAALLEEGTAEHHDTQRENDENDEINQMHSLPFLMGKAARAARILSRSGVSNL